MIRLDRVSKQFPDGSVAVRELSLEIPEGDVCVLVGPSGCGKTTTMKMVNRLVEPTSGTIEVDGQDIRGVDVVDLRRRIGYVIQHVGLFPHLDVGSNVATVPRLLRWDRPRTKARVDELLDLVGLEPGRYRSRYPHQLSGGERQRVGVARALAADPVVLLMDEPFSAIDPIARDRLQAEFLRLQSEVRKTVVFVTHDIEEAIRVGDRIAVLRQGGVLEQYADPRTLLGSPATEFVADFVGADRGLKRLSVTGIGPDDLEQPPVVSLGDTLAAARRAIGGGSVAIVVDDSGALQGWVPLDGADGKGNVRDRVRRLPARVTADATLKSAFSMMLQEDAGWVAVLEPDTDRYLGVLTPSSLHAALRRSVEAGQTSS